MDRKLSAQNHHLKTKVWQENLGLSKFAEYNSILKVPWTAEQKLSLSNTGPISMTHFQIGQMILITFMSALII